MIKNIAYYPLQCALNSKEVLTAFLESCRTNNITPIENSLTADSAVIWSVLWNGRMLKNREIYKHYRSQNKPVIVIDVGALKRNVTWKIAINNVNAQGIYGHTENLNWDRPKYLDIKITPYNKKSESILIVAQNSKSLQVENLISIEDWISKQISELNKYTDRQIIVRPHPRSKLNKIGSATIENPVKTPGTYDSFNLEYNYHAVVNYNSGPGIQAALHSCPTIVDASSLAHPVSCQINQIETLPTIDKDKWLVEVSHTEYTVDEIKNGAWIKRLECYL